MTKKIAVILSGCGFLDGSEIHEFVLTLLHLGKANADVSCFAPNKAQAKVVDHGTKSDTSDARNVLAESARIARCEILPLEELSANDFSAVIFPGGFGAALNLCDFAVKGAECTVEEQAGRVISEFHQARKPIGVICIAPVVAAKVLGDHGVELTIGNDVEIAQAIEKMGAVHIQKNVDEIHFDIANRVVSTPAYMLGQNIAEVEAGIFKLVRKIIELC